MSSLRRRTTPSKILLVAGCCLAATACGSDTDESPPGDGATETTIDMNEDVHTDPDMDMDDE